MIRWRNISLIVHREVRDQLRDRRTLFMIAVLPLLLYPALGIGMMQLTVLFREQPRTVVILGAEHLPSGLPLVEGNRFAEQWFKKKANASRLVVITDEPGSVENAAQDDPTLPAAQLLERGREVRDAYSESRHLAGEMFGTSGLQVLVIVPPDFGTSLRRVRSELAEREDGAGVRARYPRPEIIYNKADEKSQLTVNRVSDVLEIWEAAILDDWLTLARLDEELMHPVMTEPVDVSLDEQLAASVWSKLFPALLIVMSVTGAFYPAIDLVAGEKERGTMETLLICPATRTEIVLGKFITVMLFSATTAILNLASMGLTGKHIASMAPTGALAGAGDVSFPPVSALVWILLLLAPLAALFSALCLALATFARSSKEGQYYLTPLLMVTLGLTMFCLSPGVDLTPQFSVLPIVGPALLLKGLLLAPLNPGALYIYVGPVLATSLGYSALALWWAIDQFKREEVLFREGERFELGLWVRHLLRDKEPLPSFSEAVFCFVLIMLLQFFALGYLKERVSSIATGDQLMKVMLVQQLATFACPALMMGVMLTTSVKKTFRINWPGWPALAVACLLPFFLHPLSIELLARLHWFFGELPPELSKNLAAMSDHRQSIWFVLFTFAVAPAFCEELVFRGFILSGLSRGGRAALAVGLCSVAFGVVHMIPEQVFHATLVGLALGALAFRSNSLLPCVIFHFLNNGLAVLHGRFGKDLLQETWARSLAYAADGALRYRWPTVFVCVIIALPLLAWLFRPLFERRRPVPPDMRPGELLPEPGFTHLPGTGKVLVRNRD